MRIHFFTAPFYFAFIGFKGQGSRFKVQGSGGGFAAFFRGCRYPHIVRANTGYMWRKRITTDKAFPAWGRWRAKRAG